MTGQLKAIIVVTPSQELKKHTMHPNFIPSMPDAVDIYWGDHMLTVQADRAKFAIQFLK